MTTTTASLTASTTVLSHRIRIKKISISTGSATRAIRRRDHLRIKINAKIPAGCGSTSREYSRIRVIAFTSSERTRDREARVVTVSADYLAVGDSFLRKKL